MPTKTKILPAQPDSTIPTDMAPPKQTASKGSKRQAAEEYLRSAYEFQFNEITGKPEYRPAMSNRPYIAINDYRLNTFARELDSVGWQISTANIKEILTSNFVEMINPIKKYFSQLPPPGYTDHIKLMADTVMLTHQRNDFYELFKKWIVSTVACAVNDASVNHTCLVLCSEKGGVFKTTWLNNLTPASLEEYSYCNKIDPENKDTQTLLAECFIINIDDQIHKLNRRDEDAIKNLITAPYVKYRRPYDKYINKYPRMASFCASINGQEFLTDHATSRRFLPFQVESIDIDRANKINHDLLYAQAYKLYMDGFQYWFDKQQVDELYKRNEQFNIISIEEQLILDMFTREPEPGMDQAKLQLQPAALISIIEPHTKQKLSLKKVGEAMKKHGFEKVQRRLNGSTVWVYECYRVGVGFN